MFNIFGGEDENKLDYFPDELRETVQYPRDQLGASEIAQKSEIRDKFREICLHNLQTTLFNDGSLVKRKDIKDWQRSLLAYNLVMKTFHAEPTSGWTRDAEIKPPTRKRIAAICGADPDPKVANIQSAKAFFQNVTASVMLTKPRDIIMELRPLPSNMNFPARDDGLPSLPYNSTDRACRLLTVTFLGARTEYSPLPTTTFGFEINYAMRQWTIEKTYAEFLEFQDAIDHELIVKPGCLRPDETSGWASLDLDLGMKLATFLERIHSMLAARRMFSPRLMQFIGAEVLRIHLEEEGRIAKILDNVSQVKGSVWHPIDMVWLKRWQKFVLGRGCRRYRPPGPITNLNLLEAKEERYYNRVGEHKDLYFYDKNVHKEGLVLAKDYRSVNFNLYHYLRLVHGGGPCISRSAKHIESKPEFGILESAFKVFAFMLMAHAKQQYQVVLTKKLSQAEGIRAVLYQQQLDKLRTKTQRALDAAREGRMKIDLNDAAQFTQKLWRIKKRIDTTPSASLAQQKEAQEIVAESSGGVEVPLDNGNLIVEDVRDILTIPSSEIYDIRFTEETGFALGITEYAATGETVVTQVRDDGLDFVARTASDKMSIKKRPKVALGASILEIQGCPTKALSFEQVQQRLARSSFPFQVRFQYPLKDGEVEKLWELHKFRAKDVQYQAFKRMLVCGCPVRLISGDDLKPFGKSLSKLWITSTHLAWRSEPFEPNEDVHTFLKSINMSTLSGKLKQWEKDNGTQITRNMLEMTNGKKDVEGGVEKYLYAFQDFKAKKNKKGEEKGLINSADGSKIFQEVTKWRTKQVKMDFETRKACSLYDLAFVKRKEGDAKKGQFTLHIQSIREPKMKKDPAVKVYTYEVVPVPEGVSNPPSQEELRDLFVWGFAKLVEEVRGSKYYIDTEGITRRRTKAIRQLRAIDGL